MAEKHPGPLIWRFCRSLPVGQRILTILCLAWRQLVPSQARQCGVKIGQGKDRVDLGATLESPGQRYQKRNANPAFPNLCLLTSQSSAFLIPPHVVSDVRTIVAGKNDERIFDQLMSEPARIIHLPERF